MQYSLYILKIKYIFSANFIFNLYWTLQKWRRMLWLIPNHWTSQSDWYSMVSCCNYGSISGDKFIHIFLGNGQLIQKIFEPDKCGSYWTLSNGTKNEVGESSQIWGLKVTFSFIQAAKILKRFAGKFHQA